MKFKKKTEKQIHGCVLFTCWIDGDLPSFMIIQISISLTNHLTLQ